MIVLLRCDTHKQPITKKRICLVDISLILGLRCLIESFSDVENVFCVYLLYSSLLAGM